VRRTSTWVIPVVLMVLVAAVAAGLAAGVRMWMDALKRERRALEHKEKSAVAAVVRESEALGAEERAKALWAMWLKVRKEGWEYAHVHERVLMDELVSLGDPAFELLVQEIRERPRTGGSEAASHLRWFGPKAVQALVGVLQTGDREAQFAALDGLWYCVIGLELTQEQRETVRAAVTPFLDGPSEGFRRSASAVLHHMED